MSELLIGSGTDNRKRLWMPDEGIPQEWTDLTTLDFNKDVSPDIVWDLNNWPYPFTDNQFSEVHAYEVMEHVGRQGDFVAFFNQFHELWRILKPDGFLIMTCPRWDSVWAWSDPGHTRIISPEMMTFLDQDSYNELGQTTRTDYRRWWKGDLQTVYINLDDNTSLIVLKARKNAPLQSEEDR